MLLPYDTVNIIVKSKQTIGLMITNSQYICEKMISYTPCQDIAISPRGGKSLSSTPSLYCACQCYPTKLLFYDNNNKKVQLHKLPQTTIIFRIIEGTIRFNNAKIQIHVLGRDGIK